MKVSEIIQKLKEMDFEVSIYPSALLLRKGNAVVTAYFRHQALSIKGTTMIRSTLDLFGYDYPVSEPLSVPDFLMDIYLDKIFIEWDL